MSNHPFIRKRPTHARRLALFFTCMARYTGLTLSRRRYRANAPNLAHLIVAACLTGKNRLSCVQKVCYAGCRSWRMGWLVLAVVTSLSVTPFAFARPMPTAPNTLSASAQQLARQGFLVLFYLPTCPHCRRFAPVITRFARHYHLELVTVSLNGQALPTLPQTTPLTPALHQAFFNGQAASVPALFYVLDFG